ncbi:MAG TPA: hypothetical protein VGU70_04295, partial [Methylobacterium sp.]|nr:hypothetical protein [Methylobacterium sp.]
MMRKSTKHADRAGRPGRRGGAGRGTAGALLAAGLVTSLAAAPAALAQQPSPVGEFNDQTQP